MSEQNKYDEGFQTNDLPLPDMEGAWQQMKRKLDEDEDKRRILPPFVLNCLGVVLTIALLGGGWYFLSEKNLSSLQTTEQKIPQQSKPEENNYVPAAASPFSNPTVTTKRQTSTGTTQESGTTQPVNEPFNSGVPTGKTALEKAINPSVSSTDGNPVVVKNNNTGARIVSSGLKRKSGGENDAAKRKKRSNTVAMVSAASKQKPTSVSITQSEVKQPAAIQQKEADNPPSSSANEVVVAKQAASENAVKKNIADSTKVGPKDSVTSIPEKKKEQKEKKIYFTAGLGLQQIIPLDGQSSVPYNKYGRTASLSEYLPSVWVRMHRGKWFLQGEFRYGAPQSVKEFSFAQRTKYDNATGDLSVTKTVLRKTYYHQLPLTLNYHIHKNISVGAGGMYSYFYGAVTQQEVRTQNMVTGQESFKTTIVPVRSFNDSFLYKTQVHLLLQADYHWRRFNLGLRYSTDLQPYIKYTLPDGSIRTEKNHSLQVFLRYRLFPFKKL